MQPVERMVAHGPGDCNDGNPNVYPGATEVCDTIDNNCDGQINEGIAVAACGTGLPGECAGGTTTCTPSGPGPCVPDRSPGEVAETCTNFGTDDDCDGVLDNVHGIGLACDTADADLCEDGVTRCGAGATPVCTQTGPIAAYNFLVDEGTASLDVSGNAITAVLRRSNASALSNLPTWTSSGYDGGGMNFVGTGTHFQNGSEMRVRPGAEFTNDAGSIEMWVNPDFTATGNTACGWFQTENGINSNRWISAFKWYDTVPGNGWFYFRMGSNDLGCCANDLRFRDEGLILPGQWTHWVFTWDEATTSMRVYVNGVQVAAKTNVSFDNGNVANDIRIERGHVASFDGQMDDVAVYSYALSQAEVTARFTAGSFTPRDGVGNDPGGQNADLCDTVDNDCTIATPDGVDDPRVGLTNVCDSPDDADDCTDDFYTCGVSASSAPTPRLVTPGASRCATARTTTATARSMRA